MNEHLSKLIGHYRQSKNLNFPELAKLCGLNPQKWANKICNFEREGIFDSDELVHNLIRVLEINPQEVRDAVRKDHEDWETWINEPVPMQLILKLIPGIYKLVKIPDDVSNEDEALEFASGVAKEWKKEASSLFRVGKQCYSFRTRPEGRATLESDPSAVARACGWAGLMSCLSPNLLSIGLNAINSRGSGGQVLQVDAWIELSGDEVHNGDQVPG